MIKDCIPPDKDMSAISEKDKKKIIGLINVIIPDASIILFGSRARGTQQAGSDVDLALDAGRKLDAYELAEIMGVLDGTNLPYRVDVLDLNTVSDTMRDSIQKEGILWNM